MRVRSPQAERLRELLGANAMSAVVLEDGALGVTDGTPERVGELAAANNIVLHELVAEKATLEEAFLEGTMAVVAWPEEAAGRHAPAVQTA